MYRCWCNESFPVESEWRVLRKTGSGSYPAWYREPAAFPRMRGCIPRCDASCAGGHCRNAVRRLAGSRLTERQNRWQCLSCRHLTERRNRWQCLNCWHLTEMQNRCQCLNCWHCRYCCRRQTGCQCELTRQAAFFSWQCLARMPAATQPALQNPDRRNFGLQSALQNPDRWNFGLQPALQKPDRRNSCPRRDCCQNPVTAFSLELRGELLLLEKFPHTPRKGQ